MQLSSSVRRLARNRMAVRTRPGLIHLWNLKAATSTTFNAGCQALVIQSIGSLSRGAAGPCAGLARASPRCGHDFEGAMYLALASGSSLGLQAARCVIQRLQNECGRFETCRFVGEGRCSVWQSSRGDFAGVGGLVARPSPGATGHDSEGGRQHKAELSTSSQWLSIPLLSVYASFHVACACGFVFHFVRINFFMASPGPMGIPPLVFLCALANFVDSWKNRAQYEGLP